MLSQGQRFLGILLLAVLLMWSGIFLTYKAMARTASGPVPPLVQWKSTGTHWELEALGAEYALSKEAVQPERLKAQAELVMAQAAEWSQPILKEALQKFQEAAAFLRDQLARE